MTELILSIGFIAICAQAHVRNSYVRKSLIIENGDHLHNTHFLFITKCYKYL